MTLVRSDNSLVDDDERQYDEERYKYLHADEEEVKLYEGWSIAVYLFCPKIRKIASRVTSWSCCCPDEARKRQQEHHGNPEHFNLVYDNSNKPTAAIPPPSSLTEGNDKDDKAEKGPGPDLDFQSEQEELVVATCMNDFEGGKPRTQRQYNVMEKSAMFLAQQSAQMVIMIRAKQRANPWMQFLEPSHRLHAYYSTMLAAVKDGTYEPIPQPEPTREDKAAVTSDKQAVVAYDSSDDDSADNNDNDRPATTWTRPADFPNPTTPPPSPPPPSQAATTATSAAPSAPSDVLQPLIQAAAEQTQELMDEHLHPAKRAHVAPVVPMAPWLVKATEGNTPTVKDNIISAPPTLNIGGQAPPPTMMAQQSASDMAQLTAQWTANSSATVIPPPELKQVIDKFAQYVAKNGTAFEDTTRARNGNDPRFAFLQPWNEHHAYYQEMVAWWAGQWAR
eukprot:TRINITY_DN10247_c0_g2_i5.p1 TRINITY_DN10247_c0_g2~~TRINITY_DN10247_c0_g2_i5.p1  ORF type:complete len:448 (+),score=102.96 TRINITY_DN10247_c0_g2_i5:515-1858(+)